MKYKIKNRKLLIDEYFKVEKATVEFDQHYSNYSVEVQRFNLIRGFAVSILIFHKEKDSILLVRQFRYSTAEAGFPWMLELPAGLVEKDEPPLLAAQRETLEETGYQVGQIQEIKRFFVAPGCTDEEIILYYAEVSENDKINSGGGAEGEHEDIKLFFLPADSIQEYIDNNEIIDSKTLIGFYWFLQNKH